MRFFLLTVLLFSFSSNAQAHSKGIENIRDQYINQYRLENADFRARVQQMSNQFGGIRAIALWGTKVECGSFKCEERAGKSGIFQLSSQMLNGPVLHRIHRAEAMMNDGTNCIFYFTGTFSGRPDPLRLGATCYVAGKNGQAMDLGGKYISWSFQYETVYGKPPRHLRGL